jgi:hypothetical protein
MTVTKNTQERKHRKILLQQYQQQKRLQAAVAIQREEENEPTSGVLAEGVRIERVYAWLLEDLRQVRRCD